MYTEYWGLARRPFENGMQSEFFYRGTGHQAALLKLRYVVQNELGAGLLVGGLGCGKTYLAHMLARELAETCGSFVHVVYPQMSASELLAFVRKRLGAAVAPKEISFLPALPKTRSGKIMRRLLKARELGLPEGDTSTLEGGA